MKNEFTLAFNEVLEEKQLPRDIILKALESAMVSAYRRAVNASNAQHVEAKIDADTGKVIIYAEKEVVDSVQDERTEVTLTDAQKVDPSAELGSMVVVESTPRDFGRVAAQTARQVIQQRIREAERQAQMAYYEKQVGEIASGVVQAVNAQGVTIGLDMRAEGTMLRKEMIPGEKFHIHDRVRALVAEVKDGPRGPQIMLSRAHRNFLRRLLENEVPEIFHGVVEIRSIAREPGERAKVAVSATQQGIDPVGACVGMRGVRIQAIVRELHDEKIDVIEWNQDPAAYIAKAISPAKVNGVYLNEKASGGKTATVVVPEDQLSLAIGRDGQNARLAAKLTGWRIDIKSLPEAASDALNRLRTDESMAVVAEAEADLAAQVETSLARKAEGRPLTPEEYDSITRFVDRVEKRTALKRLAEKKAEEARRAEARVGIPDSAFELSILDSGLSEHLAFTLNESGLETLGEVLLRYRMNQDDLLGLPGMGPRSMQEIKDKLDATLVLPEPAAAVEAAAEAPAAEAVTEAQPEAVPAVAEQAEAPEAVAQQPAAEAEEEEPATLDEFFALRPEALTFTPTEGEEEESPEKRGTAAAPAKKAKRKKKGVEVTYDPDRDMTVARKKHKRGGGWDWE